MKSIGLPDRAAHRAAVRDGGIWMGRRPAGRLYLAFIVESAGRPTKIIIDIYCTAARPAGGSFLKIDIRQLVL